MLLLVVFRSTLIAVSSIVFNLIGVAASFGFASLVFQHGYGASLLGIEHLVVMGHHSCGGVRGCHDMLAGLAPDLDHVLPFVRYLLSVDPGDPAVVPRSARAVPARTDATHRSTSATVCRPASLLHSPGRDARVK